jgi:hypothetical protein
MYLILFSTSCIIILISYLYYLIIRRFENIT